jgi:hypothetical protein
MRTLIIFVSQTQNILYGLVVLGILLAVRGIILARQDRRVAVFALEKEAAKFKEQQAFSGLIGLMLAGSAIYIMANIVAPNMGEALQESTPTPIVFVTQSASETPALLLYPTITLTPGLPPASFAGTPTPPPGTPVNGCDIIGATISEPTAGQSVTGQVNVRGEANIIGFAQYKFELQGPSTNGAWIVVGTFTAPVASGFLGTWDSTSLAPGNYLLRLIILRPDGSYPTPCEVPIAILGNVANPPPVTP